MRLATGWVLGATTVILAMIYGPRLAGRILAVPDDVDGRYR